MVSVLFLGCSNSDSTKNEDSHYVGVILELDPSHGRFLLEETGSINPAKAKIWLTVTSESEFIGLENRSINFDDLQVGTRAEVELVDGIVLDSDPQVGTLEKLKILD